MSMLPQSRRGKLGVGITGAAAAIIAGVIAVEGGFVNNPADPGGPTKYGITQVVARANGYNGQMQDLPRSVAERIYYTQYIQRPGFAPVMAQSPAVAAELVDSAVNVGPSRASRWFQKSLNALSRGGRDYATIPADGNVGQQTTLAFQALEHERGAATACQLVIKLMDAQQAVYYMSLTHESQFIVGWVDNRIGNVPLSRCEVRS